jgi:hypothetical protein
MNRPVLEFVALPRPILDTIASRIVDLAGRNIFGNRRRDCTGATLRQDRHFDPGAATFFRHNLAGEARTESLKLNVA